MYVLFSCSHACLLLPQPPLIQSALAMLAGGSLGVVYIIMSSGSS